MDQATSLAKAAALWDPNDLLFPPAVPRVPPLLLLGRLLPSLCLLPLLPLWLLLVVPWVVPLVVPPR